MAKYFHFAALLRLVACALTLFLSLITLPPGNAFAQTREPFTNAADFYRLRSYVWARVQQPNQTVEHWLAQAVGWKFTAKVTTYTFELNDGSGYRVKVIVPSLQYDRHYMLITAGLGDGQQFSNGFAFLFDANGRLQRAFKLSLDSASDTNDTATNDCGHRFFWSAMRYFEQIEKSN